MREDKVEGKKAKGISVTMLLILISIVMYLVILFGVNESFLSLKPSNVLGGSQVWTLITYMFSHVSLIHLLFAIGMLFSFSMIIERIIGRWNFLFFYVVSGVIAGIMGVVFAKAFSGTGFGELVGGLDSVILGASGAVFAVGGLFIMLLPRLRFSIVFLPVFSLPSFIFIPAILVAFWIVSYAAGFQIGNIPLLGGFLIGVIYGVYLRKKYRSKIQLLHSGFGRMELEDAARFPSENPSPILRIARDGIVLYGNAAGKSLLREWKTSVTRPVPEKWRKLVGKALRSNTSKTVEVKFEDKVFSLSLVPVVGSDYVNMYGLDVSELKHAQKKLRNRNVELASLAGHDMKTPLTSIISITSLLIDGKLGKISDKQKENFDIILHDANRLNAIIRNMVDASRIDEGIAVYEFSKFDLLDLIRSSIKTSIIKARGREVKIILKTKSPVYVKADKVRLEQVVSNLIINAIKYGKQSGKIWVSAEKKDGNIVIAVKDNGEGIPEQNLISIFAKDFKVQKRAKRSIGGLGYGLYISRKIVEAHNGKIWVESEIGKGSTFYISIPVSRKVTKQKLK